jgi:GTP-binding protein
VKVLDVRLLRSAASAADFPRDPLPQLALVGRSNVGKSTLINALTRRTAARTSAAPGKTRLLNLYLVELQGFRPERLYLVDLPGYGYARGGAKSASEFETLVSEYFAHPPAQEGPPRGTAAANGFGPTAALLIVDSRHPGLAADVGALRWLETQARPVIVVASKIDKLSRAERQRAEREWTKALNVPILPVSAATGEGLKELWSQISKLLSKTSRESAPSAPNAPSGRDAASDGTGASDPTGRNG